MASNEKELAGKGSKEVLPEGDSSIDDAKKATGVKRKVLKTASVSEILSFSKLTLMGTSLFVLAVVVTIIFSLAEEKISFTLFGVTGLILFFGIVLDVLRWRGYSEWGALGAIIAYFGVFVMFLPLLLFPFIDLEPGILIGIELIGGIITIIGFTSHRTDLDDKIVDLLTILWYRLRTFDFRAFFSTLWQLVCTTVGGFLRYIWKGLKTLPTRIRTFFTMVIRSFGNILKTSLIVIGQTLKKSFYGIWNNLHWIGLIAVIAYVIISPNLPIPGVDPVLIKLEILIIIVFFFFLGVIYPYRERIARIATNTRSYVLQKTISAYSMLSGSKLKPAEATFCSRCLRGVENREFESLKEIKGTMNPPCPFCGFNSWVGIESKPTFAVKLAREEELAKTLIEGSDVGIKDVEKDVSTEKSLEVEVTKIPTKDPDVVTVSIEDEKAMKKGKFPDYNSYQRAQNLGAQNYAELEYIDRLGAPDLETAEKVREGGFSHYQTYQKALAVGASSVSELRIVEKYKAPDLETVKRIQEGKFPDYQSYQRAQDLGVQNYFKLQYIDRFGAPDLETAEKVQKSGFISFEVFQKALAVGASIASQYKLVKRFGAPDFETAKKMQEGKYPDYHSYKRAQDVGARDYSDLQYIDRLGAPDLETAEKVREGGFPDYKSYKQAQDAGARSFSEWEDIKLSARSLPSTDVEVKTETLKETMAFSEEMSIIEFRKRVIELGRRIDSIEWNISWHSWFLRLTDRYQNAQINEDMFKNTLEQLRNHFLQKNTNKMNTQETEALDEILSLMKVIFTGQARLILDKPQVVMKVDISNLLIELLNASQSLAESDKEIEEWYKWFQQQTDQYLDNQLDAETYSTMVKRSQDFLLGIDTDELQLDDLKDYEEIQTHLTEALKRLNEQSEKEPTLVVQELLVTKRNISVLMTELSKLSQYLATIDKEINEWHALLIRQIDKYQRSQIGKATLKTVIRRYQKFLYRIKTDNMTTDEMQTLDKMNTQLYTLLDEINERRGESIDIEVENSKSTPDLLDMAQETVVLKEKPIIVAGKASLKQAVKIIDSIFADDSIVPKRNREKWNEYKKEYFRQRSLFLDYGETSKTAFSSHLKKIKEFFISEIGVPKERVFELAIAEESQSKKQISIQDLQTVTSTIKEKVTSTIKEKLASTVKEQKITKFETSLKQAVENYNAIFADDSIVTNKNREKWNHYKKWYYKQSSLFLNYEEISARTFFDQLKKLREFFIVEMGIPSERLFELDENAPESKLTPDISDSELLICHKCGEKQPKSHSYCLECGAKLSSSVQQSLTAGFEQKDITQCILCSEDGYDGIPPSFKCPRCGRRVCENHTNVKENLCDACFLGDYLKRSQNVKAQVKKSKQGRLCPSCGARISRSSKTCDFCYTQLKVDSK